MQHREYKVVYRRYASLFFIVGVSEEEVRPRPPPRILPSPMPSPPPSASPVTFPRT